MNPWTDISSASQAGFSCPLSSSALGSASSTSVLGTFLFTELSPLPLPSTRSEHRSTPINLQSLNPSPTSPTLSNQPMSLSVTESSLRSSISTRSISNLKPADSPQPTDPGTVSMSSSDSFTDTAPATNTHGDVIVTTSGTATEVASQSSNPPRTSSTRAATSSTAGRPITARPSPAPPATTQRSVSTTVSVIPERQSSLSTVFTTVTSSAESTLLTPVSIPVTNSVNGIVSLTAPPLVTLLSTSTEADGGFVTFTHIVANPVDSDRISGPSGFLDNRNQVAGVFAAIGVVATLLILGLVWFIKRQRRLRRRKAWFASLRQQPPSPFQDALDAPFMRSIQTQSEVVQEPRVVNYTDNGYRPRSPEEASGIGLAGIGTVAAGALVPRRRPPPGGDPFSDPHHQAQPQVYQNNNTIGLALSHDRFNETSRASTPSIYPESLPPTENLPKPMEPEIKPLPKPQPGPLLRRSLSVGQTDAPPRPPRSYLRDSVNLNKGTETIPLTPPATLPSAVISKTPSPGAEQDQKGFSPQRPARRRTMLDVRPRTSGDSPASQELF